MPDRPVLTEVSASASLGAKVQLVKFELNTDYHYSMSGKWSVPEDWTEDQCREFRRQKVQELKDELEPIAEKEFEDLMKQKEEIANGNG